VAINFQEVYQKIKEIGAGARARKKTLEARRKQARDLLQAYAHELDALRDKVRRAHEQDPNLRCALPLDEALDAHYPAPNSIPNATLIAADGSQVNPDRHAALQFCLVNVGAIVLRRNSGQAPEIYTDSELLYGDELETRYGSMTEGMVALRRDLQERSKLDDLSKDIPGQIVSFTDGPIELWGARDGEEAEAYAQSLQSYLTVLSRLQSRGVITAGYVDKPAADLVVHLLELTQAAPEQLKKLREFHPLRGASDRWLYGEKSNPLLGPGERSAVFKIQSNSEKNYKGVLALHFFYLNVGTQGHPWPVRVEVPQWVADDPDKLNLLHAVLVEQCRVMGSKPYPYLLNRAHEIAVVKQEEKQQIEQLLAMEIRKQGEEPDSASYKQGGKDSLAGGRKRYGK
jgi:hypothetical protein